MVLAHIVELERGTAERDVAAAVDDLIGDDDVIGLERGDAVPGISVRDEGGAKVLEWLAPGDVVEMAVAVDDVFDRRLGHGLDGIDIRLHRPPLADRVGGDHAVRRDDEHRLMTAITEDIDVIRDLGGGEWRGSRLLRLRRCGKNDGNECSGHTCIVNPQHGRLSLMRTGVAAQRRTARLRWRSVSLKASVTNGCSTSLWQLKTRM